MTTTPRLLLPAIAAAALVLAGCAPAGPSPSPVPTVEASSTPSAEPTEPEPTVDPDILLTITATATSPSGAVADLRQVVYLPVAEEALLPEDIPQLDEECEGWRQVIAAPSFLVSDIDVTDRSGDGAFWDTPVAIVDLNGWPIFRGEVSPFQSFCSSVQVGLGATRGMTPIDGDDWESVDYGFGIATEAGFDTPQPDDVALTACTITLGEAAASSPVALAWAELEHGPLECLFR